MCGVAQKSEMHVLAVITSRMTSQRLPGKALIDVEQRPLLVRVIQRVRQSSLVTRIVVATSSEESDDPIAGFCSANSIPIFRGALRDTAGRLVAAAQNEEAAAFVRISGDSPLIDPRLIDEGIRLFSESPVDIVTNVFPRTFPAGQSVEVIATDALMRLCSQHSDPVGREHVTAGFYAEPAEWRIVNFTSGEEGPYPSFTIDTLEDLGRMEQVIRTVGDGPSDWRTLCSKVTYS